MIFVIFGYPLVRYDKNSAQVKAMESLATRLSSSAQDESRMAADTLEQIASLELNIPGPLKVLSRTGLSAGSFLWSLFGDYSQVKSSEIS